jgi:chlorinating enzyme
MEIVKDKRFFRVKFALMYLLAKLKFLHSLLPKELVDRLPLGWNNRMFWLTFESKGSKVYCDYYSQLKLPTTYRPKVEVADPYKLSEKDIRSFYEKGYIGPFDLIPPNEVDAIREHLMAVAKSPSKVYSYADGDFGIRLKEDESSNGKGTVVMSNREVALKKMNFRDRHLEDETILNLFKNPAIIERAAQLLGPDLLLWRTQFFPKSRANCGTPWHQATTYLFDNQKESVVYPPDPSELFQLTVWIALTDATKEKAAMVVARGTHQDIYPIMGGDYDEAETADGKEKNRLGTMSISVDYDLKPEMVQVVEMKAGQFFIFSERALHGSLDNSTDEVRWAINGRFVCPHTKIYSDRMLRYGHAYRSNNIVNLKLDNWKAIVVRGKDRFGLNRL